MKKLTNEEKVEVLKRAKVLLTKYKRLLDEGEINHHEGICIHNALNELFKKSIYYNLYEVQKLFDMKLVEPAYSSYSYWWDWSKKSYLIRHKAINTLIKHFQSKIK